MIFILRYFCRAYFTCVVECKIEMTRKCYFLREVINVTPLLHSSKMCKKCDFFLRHFPKIYIFKFDFFFMLEFRGNIGLPETINN